MNTFIKNIIYKSKKEPKDYEDSLLSKYGNCISIKKYGIKILFITDTHNCLNYDIEVLEYIKDAKNYDCCILLGDHTANDLTRILEYIPKEKLYGVLGNHDDWNLYKNFDIRNINGKIINIKGVKIAGIGGSYKYKKSNDCALYTHEESINIANNMNSADILISHDRPFLKQFDYAHDGLKGITEYIYKNHIPLAIHGHLHEESEEILKNGTRVLCLYKCKLIEL